MPRFRKKTQFAELIETVEANMLDEGPHTEEYNKLMFQLERLKKMEATQARRRVSPDTIALGAFNLVGICLLVLGEQKSVLSMKGFNSLIRPTSGATNYQK